MSKSLLETLVEERQQISDDIDAMVQAGDFNPEGPEFAEAKQRAESHDKRIAAVEQAVALRASADTLRTRQGFGGPAIGDPDSAFDVGEQLVRSDRFKAWVRNGASGRAKLMEIPIRRALLTTSTISPQPDRVYAGAPAQLATLLDYINRIQVSSGAVEIVSYPAADPVAGNVPESTLKPEATILPVVSTVNLVTQAHWVEATRQVIEDETRLRDFIGNSLVRGVIDKAESNAAAVITGGTGYGDASAATMIEALRIGIAQVNNAGFRATGILMNPMDAASLDYSVWSATNGNGGGTGSVWGTPVIPNGALAAGTAYVGDLSVAFHHYFRGSADLYVTDSDVGADGSSNFKKNILTFLAEYRSVTAVIRPEAVSKATATGGAPLAVSARSAKS